MLHFYYRDDSICADQHVDVHPQHLYATKKAIFTEWMNLVSRSFDA